MDHDDFLELWKVKGQQIISAQIAPALVLIAIFVTAAFGKFADAPDSARFVAIILLLIYRYAEPAKNRKKLTGRGGDFAE